MAVVYIASDHAGFALKHALVDHIGSMLGHTVVDMGAEQLNSDDDYPDMMTPLAQKVAGNPGTFGIAIGGSGQGEAMCVNRERGARAAVFYGARKVTDALDVEGDRSEDGYDIVRLARRHNNANILSLGARFVSGHEADEAVRIFLETPFSSAERHTRRLAKF